MLYGLLVGIDRYQPPVPPLGGCVNDIDAVAALLTDFAAGGDFALDLQALRDGAAKRAAVITGFRQHLAKAGPDDVALFYYSGHGSQEDAPPEFWHLEPDRLDETLDSREPGQWDLADKELAALIAEVAQRGAHVVCILDCCHSGNGTRAAAEDGVAIRRAPTDRRRRPVEAFLGGELAARLARGAAASASGWGVLPTGRHVLLAACQASETAKEVREEGRQHGAFSAALLATLRQTRGDVTYRDLVKRAEAQVRLRVAQQLPQLEAPDAADLQRPFLGGAARRPQPHFTLRQDRALGWVIDGGAVHGIPRPAGGETTTLAIFAQDAPAADWTRPEAALGRATVEEVRPDLSRVRVAPREGTQLDPAQSYRAIVIATPLPADGVVLAGDAAALELVRQALANAAGKDRPSLLVREVVSEDEALLSLEASDGAYSIRRPRGERLLAAEVRGTTPEGARLAVERLEHIARWETTARLANPGSQLGPEPVEIVVERPVRDADGNERWGEAPTGGFRLDYVPAGAEWRRPRLRIALRNRSARPLHCGLLWLGEDYSVRSELLPAGTELLPPGGSVKALGGQTIYAFVPDELWREGRSEVRELLKLIVSTASFDARLLDQEALDRYSVAAAAEKRSVGLRSTLDRLAWRLHFRGFAAGEEGEDLADWAASELDITVVRPLAAKAVPQEGGRAPLDAGVTLLGHPALRAKARLISPAETARSLENLATPALLRDDPEASQPLVFETARGTDPGLSALQLVEVENPDAVTAEAPLVLQLEGRRLAPGEHVLPFAWDGEFFLPLGAGRQEEGGLRIELRQLPAPLQTTRDVERGIVSSIRILFRKIASPWLRLGYDYPHLAAVRFGDAGEPTYEAAPEAVRARVAEARRILLYIHGVLGDTLGMSGAARAEVALLGAPPQRIADHYDLVLAFDYENIGTPIEETARALKQRLAAVGLGPDHGRTLHVAAHSMGGLVARWFTEREGGARVVQHLVTLGTPHGGSPWPTLQGWATTGLALALNGLAQVAWPVKLLGNLVAAIEAVDVSLDQMERKSGFLATLAGSEDPRVPYTLLAGNTSVIPAALEDGKVAGLLARLAPQRALHAATALAFLQAPNDIAVSVASARQVPEGRSPAPRAVEVACDHVTFFSSDAGRQLLEALQRA